MCSMDPDLRVELLTHGRLRQAVPSYSGIRHRRLLPVDSMARPWRLWEPRIPGVRALVQSASLGDSRGAIWHSSYFTLPFRWRGGQVVTIYDMNYERFPDLYATKADERFRHR